MKFQDRHIGPDLLETKSMLQVCEISSLDDLVAKCMPADIRTQETLVLPSPLSEEEALAELAKLAKQNIVFKNYIGMGYYGTHTPAPILRNILQNPGWYTQYTPYQAEIAQGRLESLLNFQTMVSDLTELPIANASLLDEATAAAEAMALANSVCNKDGSKAFFVSQHCHPQTIAVVKTKANAMRIPLILGDEDRFDFNAAISGALVQYPRSTGELLDYSAFLKKVKDHGGLAVVAADLLALTLFKSPGAMGADVAVGSTQRFGVPLGFGGPHAAYFATTEEHQRRIPGRLVGVSKNQDAKPALRLALQTREQHIRRDKATSNICTAQALLANIAAMYAVYHGPEGLKDIALAVHSRTARLAKTIEKAGFKLLNKHVFDTLLVDSDQAQAQALQTESTKRSLNLRYLASGQVCVSLDETTTESDLMLLAEVFGAAKVDDTKPELNRTLLRATKFLEHDVFHRHHSETKLMRYIKSLENKDLSLMHSMIPLGSCTMKLNAASELTPITWPEFNALHPFAPDSQTQGYRRMIQQLEDMLCACTGFAKFSLQPNSGAQGEYAGLLAIRGYLESQGQGHRNICLIPQSAHGTNPASAVVAGFKVVVVKCMEDGDIDYEDLQLKAQEHSKNLAALMVTYPSTHGVFETGIKKVCDIIHDCGGQVYMDGANMNAQIGLCLPAKFGADVCHLNLHKTFCIPHGGGGPGVGPIGVAKHLAPYIPGHPLNSDDAAGRVASASGPVAAAPWGSASILPISWMYIRMMGAEGLKKATQIAILNANYIKQRLGEYYPVLYKNKNGMVAHECIVDLRDFKASAKVDVEDVAKRLIDYGFHAPTISWPVPGTMMIEPTESESKEELDRFCEAMIGIHSEIQMIVDGKWPNDNNPLKHAPHTSERICSESWDRPYTRDVAAYPLPYVRQRKFWPATSRVDNAYGDRNLVCACPPLDSYE